MLIFYYLKNLLKGTKEEVSLYRHSVVLVDLLPGYLRSSLDCHFPTPTLLGAQVSSCQDMSHNMSTLFLEHSENNSFASDQNLFFLFQEEISKLNEEVIHLRNLVSSFIFFS